MKGTRTVGGAFFLAVNKMSDSDLGYPSYTSPRISAADRPLESVKVILLGNKGVGKTSIIAYLKSNVSTDQLKQNSTVGPPRTVGDVRVSTPKGDVKLSLWDTSTEEFFSFSSVSGMEGAKAIVFVYDISNRESFECIFEKRGSRESWLFAAYGQIVPRPEDLEDMPVVILGHKADLINVHRQITAEEAKETLDAEAEAGRLPNNYMFWETSAKNGDNLDLARSKFAVNLAEKFPNNTQRWTTPAVSCSPTVDEEPAGEDSSLRQRNIGNTSSPENNNTSSSNKDSGTGSKQQPRPKKWIIGLIMFLLIAFPLATYACLVKWYWQ